MKNPHEYIARGSLTGQTKGWFYFVCSVIFPTKHLSTIRENEAILLYAILKGYKFNMRKIIEKSILGCYGGGYRGLVPHLALITRQCILGGVEGDWEEEENCPRTAPLTLTGITKGLENKGRKIKVDIERENIDDVEIHQI